MKGQMLNEKRSITGLATLAFVIDLIFIAIGIAVIRQGITALEVEKINYLEEISYKTAQNIQENIRGHISTIMGISTFMESCESLDIEDILPILKNESVENGFKRMGIISPDGLAVTTDNLPLDLGDRDFFRNAMQGYPCVSGRVLIDKADGKEINVIAAPVYQNEQVVSVIFATRTQEDFTHMMEIDSFKGEGYSYVVTSDGYPVIKTTHKSSIKDYDNLFDAMVPNGISVEERDLLRTSISVGKNSSIESTRNGIKRQLCFTNVGINDWYLISVVPLSAISSQSNQLIINIIMFTLLIVLVTGICGYIIVSILKKRNHELQVIAYTDKITGYSNWDKFILDTKEVLRAPNLNLFAVLSLDVNKFKMLNELLGREAGNSALKGIANVLHANLTPPETFCRASLDKFSMLIHYESKQKVIARIERLAEEIGSLVKDYRIEISVGIHLVAQQVMTMEILNDRANIARIDAKQRNDTFYTFFDAQTQATLLKEKKIENAMQTALEDGEFEVYFQPKYSIQTGKMIGAEALSRWNRKGFGLVQPNDFIPLFEKNGFIKTLDAYMLRQVCMLLAKWGRSPGHPLVPISINLSRVELSDEHLPQKLLSTILESDVSVSLLEFELTESAVCNDFTHMKNILQKIRKIGARISIDDFGSGYSSFSALMELPVDAVKLDKSFLNNIVGNSRVQAIVEQIIRMAKLLGLETIAEGVETEQQVAFLNRVGCDVAQGYFYAKPLPVEQFEKLMRAQEQGI